MDVVDLSRIQFAANVTFHILFPSITIALAWFLLFFKVRYTQTGNYKWMNIYFFWTKVFALCFALGVVSGITMSFQFGTNWPGFMNTVGNIAGPLLGYEVLTAFFLEASFLGIMLFGFRKVKPWLHTFSTFLVAFGTTLSAFWILVLNSWMHTPAGFEMIDGQAFVTSWMDVIFNPSMPYRLTHKLLASGLTASFLIAGVSAYRYLKGYKTETVKTAIKVSTIVAALLIPVQIFMGDLHGLNTYEHQPQKVAAMEGNWQTQKGIPLILFAIPDEETRSNKFEISIPKLSSLIITHEEALNFYNITEGNVKIYQLLDDGRIQIIGFLYPGDFFGTSNQNKYTYSAEAIGNLKVCVFNQKSLDSYIDENPILAKELFNQTSYELTLAQDRMMILGKLNATEKVISFLNNISNQRKRIGWPNNPISLPMTRQDIADYLGLTIETVSREMKKLKDEKIIKILSTKQFYINDFEKLHNLN